MAKQVRLPKIVGGATLMALAAITSGVLLAWVTSALFPFQKRLNTPGS